MFTSVALLATFATAAAIFSRSSSRAASLQKSFSFYSMHSTLFASKKIPYGISSFEQIVEENFIFFDRTKAIEKLENAGSYLAIWRPRRSGKSLFCSQLALYYDKGEILTKVRKNLS